MRSNEVEIGKTFFRLTVISNMFCENKNYYIKCKCSCGTIVKVISQRIGKRKSCGCLILENLVKRTTKHGLYKSREYAIYHAMIDRCYNEKRNGYIYYGGKGVKVCDRWLESFENFYADMGDRPSNKHSIDRIAVKGNYEPNNCKWSTMKEQNENTTRSIRYKINGVDKTINELTKIYNLTWPQVRYRIKLGVPLDIKLKVMSKGIVLNKYNCDKILSKWAKIYNTPYISALQRYKRGCSFEQIFNLKPNNSEEYRVILPLNK